MSIGKVLTWTSFCLAAFSLLVTTGLMPSSGFPQATKQDQRVNQTFGETKIKLEVSQPVLAEATAFRFVFAGDQRNNIQGGDSPGGNPFVSQRGSAKNTVEYDRSKDATTLTISGDRIIRKGAPNTRHNVGYIYKGNYREILDVSWISPSGETVALPDVVCRFNYDFGRQQVTVVAQNKSPRTVVLSQGAFTVVTEAPELQNLNSESFPISWMKPTKVFNRTLRPGHQTPPLVVDMASDQAIVTRAMIRFTGASRKEAYGLARGGNLSLWAYKPIKE